MKREHGQRRPLMGTIPVRFRHYPFEIMSTTSSSDRVARAGLL